MSGFSLIHKEELISFAARPIALFLASTVPGGHALMLRILLSTIYRSLQIMVLPKRRDLI